MRYWIHSAPENYSEDEQRECSRGSRCIDPRIESAGGKMVRLPGLTPRAFCDADRDNIERCLRDLPALSSRVHGEIGNRGRVAGPQVAMSKTAPLPINLAVDELLREMSAVLVSWHERVADVARLSDPSGYTPATCQILAAHVEVLLALPAGPMTRSVSLRDASHLPAGTPGLVHVGAEYADVVRELSGADGGLEVLDLHHRCRRLLGETPPPARRINGIACGGCGFPELREVLDDDGESAGARCYECGTEYTKLTYAELVDAQKTAAAQAGYRRRTIARAVGDDSTARRA